MKNPLIIPKQNNSKFTRPENQSAGISDDYAVRKNVATREGTIEKVPVHNSDIVNKAYADTKLSSAVTSIKKTGNTALTGAVTLSEGSNISLTQSGQDISIASTAPSSSSFWESGVYGSDIIDPLNHNRVVLDPSTWLVDDGVSVLQVGGQTRFYGTTIVDASAHLPFVVRSSELYGTSIEINNANNPIGGVSGADGYEFYITTPGSNPVYPGRAFGIYDQYASNTILSLHGGDGYPANDPYNGYEAFPTNSYAVWSGSTTMGWFNGPHGYDSSGVDVGISRIGTADLAIGNGAYGDTSGKLDLGTLNLSRVPTYPGNPGDLWCDTTGGLNILKLS